MEILAADYLNKISENVALKVSVVAEVQETGQIVTWDDDFRLRKPEMDIQVNIHKHYSDYNIVRYHDIVNILLEL